MSATKREMPVLYDAVALPLTGMYNATTPGASNLSIQMSKGDMLSVKHGDQILNLRVRELAHDDPFDEDSYYVMLDLVSIAEVYEEDNIAPESSITPEQQDNFWSQAKEIL